MTDHTAALLPCPFCGGTTIHVSPPTCKRTDKYDPADRGFPIVHCGLCGAEANGKNWDESCASAIAAWNRRAQPQQPAGWKLVPVEPTEEMRQAGAQYAECGISANAVFAYRAMLSAAPAHPSQQEDDARDAALREYEEGYQKRIRDLLSGIAGEGGKNG